MPDRQSLTPSPKSFGPRASRREWIGLAVLTLPTLLLAMDMTVLHLAVPSLSAALEPTSAQLLWIVDIYGFMIAGFLIIMGNIGDWIGRRKLLLLGAAAFGAASVFAAFAPNAELLILARSLLGISGACLMPSTLSLIRNMFKVAAERTKAITIWMMSFMVGTVIGPVVGGLLLEWFWWGAVFLLAVPVMMLILILGPKLLPEHRNDNKTGIDLLSAVMALAAILLLVFTLKDAARYGFNGRAILTGITGLGIGTVFIIRQTRLENPLLDLALFQYAGFSAALVSLTVSIFTIGGSMFLIYQYLQGVLGFTPLQAGLWLLPSTLAGPIVSFAVPALAGRIAPNRLIGAGLALGTVSLASLALIGPLNGLAVVVVGMTLLSIGLAPVTILGTDLIVSAAPAEQAGAASAVSETGTELGMALGVAVFGSLATALYRSGFQGRIGDGLPTEFGTRASETLGAAIAIAKSADGQLAEQMIKIATQSFTNALQISVLTAATLLGLICIVALRSLPRHTGGSETS